MRNRTNMAVWVWEALRPSWISLSQRGRGSLKGRGAATPLLPFNARQFEPSDTQFCSEGLCQASDGKERGWKSPKRGPSDPYFEHSGLQFCRKRAILA